MGRKYSIARSLGDRIFDSINVFLMLCVIFVTLYPMLHVLFASLSSPSAFMFHEGVLLKPAGFSLSAYKAVFQDPSIRIGYTNTIFIVVVGVLLNIAMTSVCAYVLSRKRFYMRNAFMFVIVITMFFSGGLIPFFLTIKWLHLDNTIWVLIFPGAMSSFNMIIMRTSFNSIPDSLEESAKLDGAGHIQILLRVVLPLSMPVIAVMILYYAVGHWNSWFNASIFLRDAKLYPLQLVLRRILIQNNSSSMMTGGDSGMSEKHFIGETIKYTVIVVSTLPILVLYPFLQRYFVKGVMIGALKG